MRRRHIENTIRSRDSDSLIFTNILLREKEVVNSDCRFGCCMKNCIGGWGGESVCETANREIVSFRSCVRAGEARRSCEGEREAMCSV